VLSNCYYCSRQQLGLKSQLPIKSWVERWLGLLWGMPWMLVMLYLVLPRDRYRTFIQTYSATSPLKSTLGNGQIFFSKLLSKSNNLCGSGSGRIFALPLTLKKDRFRFQLPLPQSLVTVGYLLLWRNYMPEACWLLHNKNSKWLKQLVLGPGVAHSKASSRRQRIFWWTKRKS